MLWLALFAPGAAAAGPVRLVASDARGVTLQVSVGVWALSAPGPDGRVTVTGLPESHSMSIPGRPLLPAYSAMLALPPDARPTAHVIAAAGELARDAVEIAIAGMPVFRDEPGSQLGPQPGMDAVEPILDGPWPPSRVELATPFAYRGRRLVTLEVRPMTYDPAARRLTSPLTLTVRVDFNRPGGAAAMPVGSSEPDRHVDPALEASVLNWRQGQLWRLRPRALASAESGSLFARETAGRTRALAFDESQPEVRVTLDQTAVYRLDFDELAAKGYPAGVPVGEVSVHRHEYLEGVVPPYGTVELPCEIDDANGNGTFDGGDGVWVWVRNWAERSNATNIRRFWGDAEVVFVTRRSGGGLRLAQRPGWNNVAGLTPLASYPFKRHFERDAAPIMNFVSSPVDTNIGLWQWTDFSLYYERPDTIRIDTHDLDASHPVNTTVRWVGRKFDNHFMWAAIRNGANVVTPIADSVNWSGKLTVTVNATLPGSALTEGNTNFFRQWGKNLNATPDPNDNAVCFAGLDWFELTYWRRYRAVNDYVQFNSGLAAGDFQLSVGGFSTDSLHVYDITDPDNPVRITIDPAHLSHAAGETTFELQDVATPSVAVPDGRRQYVAAASGNPPDPAFGPRVPPASAYGSVVRRNVYANVSGDYLLVTPEQFAPATTPLAGLRRSQGLSVVEAPTESIYDEFNGGRHSGAALERFAKFAYERWNARFLMLVGDGTLDPLGVRPFSGRDYIPVLPTPGPVGASEGLEIIASDNQYGNITGNQDPIASLDSNRVVPELMVGRLTVNSPAEATNIIGKIIAYEDLSRPDAWRRNVLLNADDAFSGETTFGGGSSTSGYCHRSYEELFVGLNHTMKSFIDSDSGVTGMNVEEFNLRSYLLTEHTSVNPVNGDTCRVSRDETRGNCHAGVTPILLGKLNSGQLVWNYQGHANEFVLTHEDLFVNQGTASGDELRLANDDKPFLFTAFSCHANMFAHPEHQLNSAVGPCLGEDLLALPNGRGAVASWASVCFEVVPRDDHTHINVELIRSMFVNPPRDEFLGADDRGSRVVLGEVILSALFRYVGTTQSYALERGLSTSYTLLGDPATRVSIGHPFDTVTANDVPVTSGTPVRLHTPGNTLRIDANLVSNVELDSLALSFDRGGVETPIPSTDYNVSPAFPDTAAGGVFGGRHFRIVYVTQPEARSTDYIVTVRDRNGLLRRTVVRLQLDAVLRSNNVPINDGDEVAPTAALSIALLSPRPILVPQAELTLTVKGELQAFTATPAPSDGSGREWILTWSHPDYPIDGYPVVVSIQNGGSVVHEFKVTASSARLALRNLFPFPNPFDNDGTRFSFQLLGGEDADVKVHVFSQSGRSIYTTVVRGLTPGYHQLAWDGRDAEGDELANGIYFYRLSVTTPSGATTQQLGRLVKLRRPRHIVEPVVP